MWGGGGGGGVMPRQANISLWRATEGYGGLTMPRGGYTEGYGGLTMPRGYGQLQRAMEG